MIPITSAAQATEIANTLTAKEARELIIRADAIEQLYRCAFEQRQNTDDLEVRKIFGQLASDYANQLQLANEALRQYHERIRRTLEDACAFIELLPEANDAKPLLHHLYDEIERMK